MPKVEIKDDKGNVVRVDTETAKAEKVSESKSFPEQVLANILPKSSTDDLLRRTPVMSPPSPSSAGWALVTGASSGIGRALATQLAASKHDIVAVARNATRLEALAGELRREWDVRVRVISINLADPDAAPVPGVSTWGGGRPPLLSRTTTTGRRHEHSNPT